MITEFEFKVSAYSTRPMSKKHPVVTITHNCNRSGIGLRITLSGHVRSGQGFHPLLHCRPVWSKRLKYPHAPPLAKHATLPGPVRSGQGSCTPPILRLHCRLVWSKNLEYPPGPACMSPYLVLWDLNRVLVHHPFYDFIADGCSQWTFVEIEVVTLGFSRE